MKFEVYTPFNQCNTNCREFFNFTSLIKITGNHNALFFLHYIQQILVYISQQKTD